MTIGILCFLGGILYTLAGFGWARFAVGRGWVPLWWQRWGVVLSWPVTVPVLATRHGLA